ncbi:hypothetical protein EVAR_3544_1 [Eumeta japonica]|uniref:Uncharacterized protein n=1 Tax=Eumeta variegata TaxID=151549 RepID=A0A4C1SY38_EUMVA|nr:hypothetical protein EVAR_3544_1 [Eumeta japonica]
MLKDTSIKDLKGTESVTVCSSRDLHGDPIRLFRPERSDNCVANFLDRNRICDGAEKELVNGRNVAEERVNHRNIITAETSNSRRHFVDDDEAPSLATVHNHFNEIKRGGTNLTDDLSEGRSSTATTEDNFRGVRLIIETDEKGPTTRFRLT